MRNGSKNVILQARDLLLLRTLSDLRLLSRDQIAALSGFQSITRVNVRLAKLTRAGLIQRYFVASESGGRSSIYALTRKGSQTAQLPFQPLKWLPNSIIIGNAFAAHQLAINEIRVAASDSGRVPVIWKTLDEPIAESTKLIPDALIERQFDTEWRSLFLEVDLGTEALPTWTKKVQQYLQLATSGNFRDVVQADRFAVLVVANSDARSRQLRAHIAVLTQKLFWFTTLKTIKERGFWSPIWLRPVGDQQVPPGA